MLQAGERREKERVLETVVAEPRRSVATNRGAGLVWGGTQSSGCGQLSGGAKLADVTNVNQDPRPEAGSNPRQALDDARLGEGEKRPLDLLFEVLTADD